MICPRCGGEAEEVEFRLGGARLVKNVCGGCGNASLPWTVRRSRRGRRVRDRVEAVVEQRESDALGDELREDAVQRRWDLQGDRE